MTETRHEAETNEVVACLVSHGKLGDQVGELTQVPTTGPEDPKQANSTSHCELRATVLPSVSGGPNEIAHKGLAS